MKKESKYSKAWVMASLVWASMCMAIPAWAQSPVLTSLTFNALADGGQPVGTVSDGLLAAGAWAITGHVYDVDGVYLGVDSPPFFAAEYDLVDQGGVAQVDNQPWVSKIDLNPPTQDNIELLDIVPLVNKPNISLGNWHLRYTIYDLLQNTTVDDTTVAGAHVNTFTVIDDDQVIPVSPSFPTPDEVAWTNLNPIPVSWLAATDDSGIYQVRRKDVVPPVGMSDGVLIAPVIQPSVNLSMINPGFEIAAPGTFIPYYWATDFPVLVRSTPIEGWLNFSAFELGSDYSPFSWTEGTEFSSEEARSGSQSVKLWMQDIASGWWYVSVHQDVPVFNPDNAPVDITFGGFFKGDMSVVIQGVQQASAFLEVQFLDSVGNVIGIGCPAVRNQTLLPGPPCAPDAVAPFQGVNVPVWTYTEVSRIAGPANTKAVRLIAGMSPNAPASSAMGAPLQGFWDDLSATISVGRAISSINYSPPQQGYVTNWLWAIDDDNDRTAVADMDRLAGGYSNFVVKYDSVAPLDVAGTGTAAGPGDPNKEIRVSWTALANAGGTDPYGQPLSPFKTYKVYYTEGVIGDLDGTDPFVTVDDGYTSLGDITTDTMIMSNLLPNTLYSFAVSGLDEAGNERSSLSWNKVSRKTLYDDPEAQSYDVDTDEIVTDAQITSGVYSVGMTIEHGDGMEAASVSAPFFIPNYDILNNAGAAITTDEAFPSITHQAGGTRVDVADPSRAAVAPASVDLGTYSVRFSAISSNQFTNVNETALEVGTPMNFTVVDDDSTPPVEPTSIVVTPGVWTNVKNWAVTYSQASDAFSGVKEYRLLQNPPGPTDPPPTLPTDGVVRPDALISSGSYQPGLVIVDGTFEGQANGFAPPSGAPSCVDHDGAWYGHIEGNSPGGPMLAYSTEQADGGTRSLRMAFDEHEPIGAAAKSSYIAAEQEITVPNALNESVRVVVTGRFKGDMSKNDIHWGETNQPSAAMTVCFLRDNLGCRETIESTCTTPLRGVNASTWTDVSLDTFTLDGDCIAIRVGLGVLANGSGQSVTGYWDNIQVDVYLGVAGVHTELITLTDAYEGQRTNWLFVVDDDQDRTDDALMSPVTNFTTFLDQTPPVVVGGVGAGPGPDDNSQIRITWTPLLDGGGANLSPWYSYRVYYTDQSRDPDPTLDPFIGLDNGPNTYASLGNITTAEAIISNLSSDVTYNMAVVGRDLAGNEGPVDSLQVASFTVLPLTLTQGVTVAVGGTRLSWRASTNAAGQFTKPYDLIYVDNMGFHDSLTSAWGLVATVTNNMLIDTGYLSRPSPVMIGETMRFYRAAAEGKWSLTNTTPHASREVYVAKNIRLENGHNFISLFMEPDTNTLKAVMGTDLYANNGSAFATQIEWYDASMNGNVTNSVYLHASPTREWRWLTGGSGVADNKPMPIGQGFNVKIPTNGPYSLLVIGKVPSNEFEYVVSASGAGPLFNIANNCVPRWTRLDELNFEGSGLVAAGSRRQADEIRVLAKGIGPFGSPRLRAWLHTDGNWRRWEDSSIINHEKVAPDESIIIYTRKSTTPFVWTNKLHYTPPGKNMNP